MERRRLRQLFRLLRREPLFCLATAGVLALGIGASTAMLSVVDAILFRPLALPDSERVVTLCETHATVSGHCTASPPNVMDWASRSRTLAAVGIGRTTSFAWRGDDGARWLTGGIATPGFFRALGIEPLLGRLLEDRDLPPRAAEPVAVVSEAFWRRELGGDPQALGRRLVLDETAHTVVGVLPGDRFVPWSTAELWTPVPFDPRDEEHRGWRGFMAVARLAAGATPHAAQTELAGLQRQLEAEHPAELRGWGTDVAPLRERLVGDSRPALLLFLAAVVVLLMVVCASTATLLIARAAGRESELALRKALGATAADAWRQQLREAGLLVLLGTLGGLLVAWAAVRGFVALAPAGIPRVEEIAVDLRMVLLGLAAAAVTASAVALVLVARQRRLEPGEVLRSPRGAGRRESRARRAVVVAQLALAVMLVVGAGLLARSRVSASTVTI